MWESLEVILKTRAQALRDLGIVIAEIADRTAGLTPREAAERAWDPSQPLSVEQLAVAIAAGRSLYRSTARGSDA